MSRAPVREIVVLTSRRSSWLSMRRIIPALERAWAALGREPGRRVRVVAAGEARFASVMGTLLKADLVVVTVLTPATRRCLLALRERLRVWTPLVLHTHGEGTAAAARLGALAGILTEADLFLAASRREARSVRLCFPRADARVVPFPIGLPGRLVSRRAESGPRRFVFAGRVSEQKGLHVVLLALRVLARRRPAWRGSLDVYGVSDGLGSPNMGFRFKTYGRFLRRVAATLGLGERVRWLGRLSPDRLRGALGRDHVFVSASLHSDEDFGVAALDSLCLGGRAALSDWGGHADLKERFGSSVSLARPLDSPFGPFVPADRLADAMARALQARPGGADGARAYSIERCARALSRLCERVGGRPARPLRLGPAAARVHSRIGRLPPARPGPGFAALPGYGSARIFAGYDDALLKPFLRAYGVGRRGVRGGRVAKTLLLVPWVRVERDRVVVRDPHRGFRALPRRSARPQRTVACRDVLGRSWLLSRRLAFWLLRCGLACGRQ